MPAIVVSSGPGLARSISKTITFTGAAGLGATGSLPVFTVTGEVLVAILVPTVTLTLVGAGATISLGVTSSVSLFVAASTATTLATGEAWLTTTGAANGLAVPAAFKDIWITDNIIGDILVAGITAGSIRFDLWYGPLSPGATVT